MVVAIVPNFTKDPELLNTAKVVHKLKALGAQVVSVEEYAHCLAPLPVDTTLTDELIGAKADFIVSIGGDGTFLSAARLAWSHRVPVLGINLGTVGYLADVEMADLDCLDGLFSGDYTVQNRMMLDIQLIRGKETVASMTALNEAAVLHGTIARMLRLQLNCNGKLISNYKADGILVATPTGSTAYSLAAGGPVIDPAMSCLCMVTVCAHALDSRPVVFSDQSVLEITLTSLDGRDAFLSADGRGTVKMVEGDVVRITRSPMETRMVKLHDLGFYDILSNKLSGR